LNPYIIKKLNARRNERGKPLQVYRFRKEEEQIHGDYF
jgi:hypothetical protein